MRIAAYRRVSCYDHQILFLSQRLHPDSIFHIWKKLVSQMDNPVLGMNHLVESVSDLNREIVVEEKLHAARACSKSTAATTDSRLISNHRATSWTESFARTLRDKIFVEMPSLKTIG